MKAIAALLVLVVAALGGYYVFGGEAQGGTGPVEVVEATDEDNAPADAVELTAEVEEAKGRPPVVLDPDLPEKFRLYFPDGTWLPALNGAKNPAPVQFRDRPYSPVVRKTYDPKFKRHFYVHADGSYSTTVPSPFRGKNNTITQVTHPGGKPHILLDDGPGGSNRAIPPKKPAPTKGGARQGARAKAKQSTANENVPKNQ